MIETVLFIALPYAALVTCLAGCIYRAKVQPLSYSALSSQFLEGKSLIWGSLPWHIGILLILLVHLIVATAPRFWQKAISYLPVLITIETIGIALSAGCLFGLVLLFMRRFTSARIQAVTTLMDIVILLLLMAQVGLGLGTALSFRWGSAWSVGTMVPYMWSILMFHPSTATIEHLPLLARAHIVGGWLIILLIPFSRLVHMFTLPLPYLWRPPQRVVWTNPRRLRAIATPEGHKAGS